jgi:hypothetical protein
VGGIGGVGGGGGGERGAEEGDGAGCEWRMVPQRVLQPVPCIAGHMRVNSIRQVRVAQAGDGGGVEEGRGQGGDAGGAGRGSGEGLAGGFESEASPGPHGGGEYFLGLEYSTCECPLDREVAAERHCADIRDFSCALTVSSVRDDETGDGHAGGEGGAPVDRGSDARGEEGAGGGCWSNFEAYDYRGEDDGDPPCVVLQPTTVRSRHAGDGNKLVGSQRPGKGAGPMGLGEEEDVAVRVRGSERAGDVEEEGWRFQSTVECRFDDWPVFDPRRERGQVRAEAEKEAAEAAADARTGAARIVEDQVVDGFRYHVWKDDGSFASGYDVEMMIDLVPINMVVCAPLHRVSQSHLWTRVCQGQGCHNSLDCACQPHLHLSPLPPVHDCATEDGLRRPLLPISPAPSHDI